MPTTTDKPQIMLRYAARSSDARLQAASIVTYVDEHKRLTAWLHLAGRLALDLKRSGYTFNVTDFAIACVLMDAHFKSEVASGRNV